MKDGRRLFNLVRGETRFGYKAEANAETKRVYLYDEISWFGVTAADFVSELASLGGQDFELHVNSPGGDVFEGLAMLNSLRAYPGNVTAVVDGIAASAASFLIMGANEIVMQKNTELMIHDAWGLCIGNSADMRDTADRLDKVSDNIADIYSGRTGDPVTEWRDRMRAEVWYSANEAVEVGLATRVADSQGDASALAFDLSRFNNRKTPETAQSVSWNASEFLRALKEARQ